MTIDLPAAAAFMITTPAPAVVEADLDRLAGDQRDDGGWDFEHVPHSAAAVLDWRGHVTLLALEILQANGRVPAPSR